MIDEKIVECIEGIWWLSEIAKEALKDYVEKHPGYAFEEVFGHFMDDCYYDVEMPEED